MFWNDFLNSYEGIFCQTSEAENDQILIMQTQFSFVLHLGRCGVYWNFVRI